MIKDFGIGDLRDVAGLAAGKGGTWGELDIAGNARLYKPLEAL